MSETTLDRITDVPSESSGRKDTKTDGRRSSGDWWLAEERSTVWLRFDRLILVLLLLGLWELLVRRGTLDDRFVAGPISTVEATWQLLFDSSARSAVIEILWIVGLAFLIAVGAGSILGAVLGLSPWLYRAANPVVHAIYSIPKLFFIPLFVLALGMGPSMKLSFAAIVGTIPVTVAISDGVRGVDQRLLAAGRSLGMRRWQTAVFVSLPGASSAAFVGFTLAAKDVLTGVVVTELLFSQGGLGWILKQYTSTFRPDHVFGLLVLISTAMIVAIECLSRLERRLMRWKESA